MINEFQILFPITAKKETATAMSPTTTDGEDPRTAAEGGGGGGAVIAIGAIPSMWSWPSWADTTETSKRMQAKNGMVNLKAIFNILKPRFSEWRLFKFLMDIYYLPWRIVFHDHLFIGNLGKFFFLFFLFLVGLAIVVLDNTN